MLARRRPTAALDNRKERGVADQRVGLGVGASGFVAAHGYFEFY
jgi:hypothetical protein